MKPGGFLWLSGEAHRAGREGRTRLEIHAQKVEATRHAADEGLLRVLLQPGEAGKEGQFPSVQQRLDDLPVRRIPSDQQDLAGRG